MSPFWQTVLLCLGFGIDGIRSQGGGTLADGNYYVCVPPGYCDNNNPSNPGIDPRIVTPTQAQPQCPAGQVACITQGPDSLCGNRFITQTNTADGLADPGAYPWQAYIRNSTLPVYAGSGVLLDNYHVLTAAHKIAGDANNPSAVTVIMGVYNPADLTGTQTRTASQITVHPMYNPATLINDIAIVTVSPPFALNSTNINTACLPATGTSFVGQQSCVVAGWGETAFGQNDQPTNPMKQVYVNVVDYNTCRTSLATVLLQNVDVYLDPAGEICAGGEAMKDACTYDGGAPLMCPGTGQGGSIAGLVIWGKNCGQPNIYGVYVSVPYYRGWIDTTLTQLNG